MVKFEIGFIGEDTESAIYEGVILWDRGYFAIHSINGKKIEGYIPLTAIRHLFVVKEDEDSSETN